MAYPDWKGLPDKLHRIIEYTALQHEYGCDSEAIKKIIEKLESNMADSLDAVLQLSQDPVLKNREPDELEKIKKLRPKGPRILRKYFDSDYITEKMSGAVLGRFSGCMLGVPVENFSIDRMQRLAEAGGDSFPPENYWSVVENAHEKHYGISKRSLYTHQEMCAVQADDDITYTLLALLILEEYGYTFTTKDVGEAWLKYLPTACTAEAVALDNLRAGVPAKKAAEKNNPYCQWIGADIRSDGFAYASAGMPELAAELGYRDAYLSHRRNGIYGEMFFAAAQAAAFCVEDPLEAVKIGMTEIPAECTLYKDLEWTLSVLPEITSYLEARKLVDEHFAGMHCVHTNNNAALTVMGLYLGNGDFTKTISNVVAMGLDNDCTGATAGSIIGAICGKSGIPGYWYENFNNKIYCYLNDHHEFELDDVIIRYVKLVESRMDIFT